MTFFESSVAGIAAFAIAWSFTLTCLAAGPAPDYSTQIAPILKKYCAGCHNDEDAEGELSLESFAAIGRGGEHGPALQSGDARASRMIRQLTGKAKPAMPPEDEPQPSAQQVALLVAWVDAGAKGPDGQEPDRTRLLVPKLQRSAAKPPVTALAYSPDGAQFRGPTETYYAANSFKALTAVRPIAEMSVSGSTPSQLRVNAGSIIVKYKSRPLNGIPWPWRGSPLRCGAGSAKRFPCCYSH